MIPKECSYRTAMVTSNTKFEAGTVVSVRVWGRMGSKILYSCWADGREEILPEDHLTDFT